MSILDRDPDARPVIPPDQIASKDIKIDTYNTFQRMASTYNVGARLLWNNPNGASPNEVAVALGTDAQEIFSLHYQLGQLIQTVKPEAISEGLSYVVSGAIIYNPDGSINIDEDLIP